MPLAELEQNVQMEIDDNPALETTPPEDDSFSTNEESTDSSESYEESLEREERADALDTALQNMGSDDEMPEPSYKAFASGGAEYEEITYGDQRSFYDQLKDTSIVELEIQSIIDVYAVCKNIKKIPIIPVRYMKANGRKP